MNESSSRADGHPRSAATVKQAVRLRFRGFRPEAFRFFRRLARNNHKPWFDRNRELYEEHVTRPLKALFEALVPVVLSLHPDFEVSGKTGRNFSRINRDIRFARDKSPYRTNRYLYFGHPSTELRVPRARVEGQHASSALDARLYVGLSADGVTCGFAAYDGRDSALARLLKPRLARDSGRAALDRLLRRLARPNRASRYEMYWHGMERGEWKKYVGAPKTDKEWKRCKAFIVRRRFAPGRRELRSARFARTVAQVFRQLFPLYAFTALEGRAGDRALI